MRKLLILGMVLLAFAISVSGQTPAGAYTSPGSSSGSGTATNGTGGVNGAQPLASGNYALSNFCPPGNTGNCFYTPANTQVDNTASWTTSNGIITITSGRFTAADVGKTAWGYSSAAAFSGNAGCNPFQLQPTSSYITLTHVTISSFTDSNHVVVSSTPAVASTNATSCFIWGTPDDTAATALETAYDASTSCPKITMEAGFYMFTTMHFNSQPTACANLGEIFPNSASNAFGNVWLAIGVELEGRGVGPTKWFIPPDFPETGTCNFGFSSTSCFIVPTEGYYHSFAISSGNGRGGIPASTYLYTVGVGTLAEFTCTGVGDEVAGTVGLFVNAQAQLQQVNLSACGKIGVLVASNTGNVVGSIDYRWPAANAYRLSVDNVASPGGADVELQQNARFGCHNCQTFGTQDGGAGVPHWINLGGELWLEASGTYGEISTTPTTAYACTTNAGCILHLRNVTFNGAGISSTPYNGIQCTVACTNYIEDSTINAAGTSNTGWLDDVSGSNTYLGDGVVLTAGTPTINGTVHHRESGTCTFAASTTCTVNFTISFGATTPAFLIPPNIVGTATTLTVSALSATAATITASASNSSGVQWEAIVQ
jgi:hypothetical protein